ncbi:hypothetical protein V493_08181 [Pseudogymnoascus sp. VKM F-4281 (FW-2241)]|nr:hypothetical protein V493_08181 [Pseudogymnoascus sp. VKM F-4281 (FW-2241)]
MASQPKGKTTKDKSPGRKWTDFEGTVLMSLIIRNVHKTGLEKDEFSKLSDSTAPRHKHRNSRRVKEVADPDKFKYVDVATALNRALHRSDYTNDIPVEEVEKLLHFFLRDRKGAIAIIERQPTARLTRSTHRIWLRGLKFLGTQAEWEGGRKAAEEVKRREDQERRLNVGNAGTITSDANGAGVADGWGNDTAAAPSGDGWGTTENDNNADASAAVGVWGDAMEVDTPAIVANNLKASLESSHVEAGSGAWGSGVADSSSSAVINAEDPWAAPVETTAKSNSTAAAWGEPEASAKVVTTTAATASDWSVNEDPFATPLPPSLSSVVNKATTLYNAWGVPDSSTNTNGRAVNESNPWNETSAGRTDPVSDTAGNAWGANTINSTTGFSPVTTHSRGKTADTAADPWGTSAKSTLSSLHNPADTAADPWGTSAESTLSSLHNSADTTDPWGISTTASATQSSAMDWEIEVSNMAPATSSVTKNVEQAGSLGAPVDKPVPMGFSDSWGEPVANAPNQAVGTTADEWGEPATNTPYQSVTTTAGGWRENIEIFQGHMHTSQTITAAELNRSEGGRTPAPVPLGWGDPTPAPFENPIANMSLSVSIVQDKFQTIGMSSSNGFQYPSRQIDNFDKEPNNLIPAVQLAASGMNPDRLAMLAAAETEDDEISSFETNADEELSRGRKSFKSSPTFGSKDNAIPLRFNRLAGIQAGARGGDTTGEDHA